MSRRVLVLIGICALTFFAGLGQPAITDSDEAFYAESAREMVEAGDWLTPYFNYAVRFDKPVFYYWLAAGSYLVSGVGEAAARFPSALAGLGLTLLTFGCARRLFDTATGQLAGTITATSFGYVMMARQALPDLPLAFFITLSVWASLLAWCNEPAGSEHGLVGTRQRWWWSIVAGAAAAGALLTKGPVGIVLPVLIVTPLISWERLSGRSTWRVRRSHVIVATLVFLALGAPWFLEMTIVHGTAYLDRFFVGENIDRFATARYNDPRALWYYVPIVAGGMLPWSPFMLLWLPALGRLVTRSRRMTTTELRLAWWAVAPLLFFTMSIGKQPRYILPILPPLAILLARTMRHRTATMPDRDRAFGGCAVLAGLLLMVIGGLAYRARPLFVEGSAGATAIVAGAIVVSGLVVLIAAARRRDVSTALAAASIITALGAHYVFLATAGPAPVERMAQMVVDARESNEAYGRHRIFTRNLVFYTETESVDISGLETARNFLSGPERVLCVLLEEDAGHLESQGVHLSRLGEITYLNTGNLNFRTLLNPDPDRHLQRVVLVTNR